MRRPADRIHRANCAKRSQREGTPSKRPGNAPCRSLPERERPISRTLVLLSSVIFALLPAEPKRKSSPGGGIALRRFCVVEDSSGEICGRHDYVDRFDSGSGPDDPVAEVLSGGGVSIFGALFVQVGAESVFVRVPSAGCLVGQGAPVVARRPFGAAREVEDGCSHGVVSG